MVYYGKHPVYVKYFTLSNFKNILVQNQWKIPFTPQQLV